MAGIPKPRITDLRNGKFKPNAETRIRLEKVTGIPARMWDAPATTQDKPPEQPKYVAPPKKVKVAAPAPASPTPPARPQPAAPPPPVPPPATHEQASGVQGIEQVIREMRAVLPELPAKERQGALKDIAGLLKTLEDLRTKRETARDEYLRSAEFLAEAQALLAAFPASVSDFRLACARVGIDLPEPPKASVASSRTPPTSVRDIEDMIKILDFAAELRAHGEPHYALAQTLALELDVHTEAIARVLATDAALANRFLSLLEPVDRAIIGRALDVRSALDACRGHAPTAALLRAIGREDLACTL